MPTNRAREYQWVTEEPLTGGSVRVTAYVSGTDTPARGPTYSCGGTPPEYRDVEITVERVFCPSLPDQCKGCEWEDITDGYSSAPFWSKGVESQWEEWLDTLRSRAIEKEDDEEAAAEEYYRERRSEERFNPNTLRSD